MSSDYFPSNEEPWWSSADARAVSVAADPALQAAAAAVGLRPAGSAATCSRCSTSRRTRRSRAVRGGRRRRRSGCPCARRRRRDVGQAAAALRPGRERRDPGRRARGVAADGPPPQPAAADDPAHGHRARRGRAVVAGREARARAARADADNLPAGARGVARRGAALARAQGEGAPPHAPRRLRARVVGVGRARARARNAQAVCEAADDARGRRLLPEMARGGGDGQACPKPADATRRAAAALGEGVGAVGRRGGRLQVCEALRLRPRVFQSWASLASPEEAYRRERMAKFCRRLLKRSVWTATSRGGSSGRRSGRRTAERTARRPRRARGCGSSSAARGARGGRRGTRRNSMRRRPPSSRGRLPSRSNGRAGLARSRQSQRQPPSPPRRSRRHPSAEVLLVCGLPGAATAAARAREAVCAGAPSAAGRSARCACLWRCRAVRGRGGRTAAATASRRVLECSAAAGGAAGRRAPAAAAPPAAPFEPPPPPPRDDAGGRPPTPPPPVEGRASPPPSRAARERAATSKPKESPREAHRLKLGDAKAASDGLARRGADGAPATTTGREASDAPGSGRGRAT